MPTLILHAGAHKTGTKLIQAGLRRNAPWLQQRGIAYVDPAQADSQMVRWLDRSRSSNEEACRAIGELLDIEARRGGSDELLVSHESTLGGAGLASAPADQFYADRGPRLERLHACLDSLGWTLEVIWYVRRQDRWIESVYLEGVAQGYIALPFDVFLSRLDAKRLSWLDVALEIEAVVGPGRLSIRPFEQIRSGSADYLLAFVAPLTGDTTGCDTSRLGGRNRSLSQVGLASVRIANRHLSGAWAQRARRIARRTLSNRWLPPVRLLEDGERADLLALHREGNQALFERFVPDWPKTTYSGA